MTAIAEHRPSAGAPAARATPPARPGRVVGLDGIRGLAALFVVLNHIFERAWPGLSAYHAPFWAAWMIYGRFAVIMFIALSGFSLGLGPARSGWRFKSMGTYAHRRAWRILPPYWSGPQRLTAGGRMADGLVAYIGRTVRRTMHAAGSPLRLRTRTALPSPPTGTEMSRWPAGSTTSLMAVPSSS